MKPFYPMTRPAPILFLTVMLIGMAAMCSQCSVQYETTYQENYKEVNRTTSENRNIVGYEHGKVFKKRVYYLVTDSEGNPAPRILKYKNEPLRPIGGVFMLDDEYKMQN